MLIGDVGVIEVKVTVFAEGVRPELGGREAAASTAGNEVGYDGTATHD